MKKKPKGQKYRNLYARGGVIWYRRILDGKRVRFSTKTDDWDEAVSVRDLWEQTKGVGQGVAFLELPLFAAFADRYLEEDTRHLAQTTHEDRTKLLGKSGRVRVYFGEHRLDDITKPALLEWWAQEVDARDRAFKTGKNYLDALSAVLSYAVDLEVLDVNPCDAFRKTLQRRNRTARGRAEADGVHVHPIEDPEQLDAFVAASETEGGDGHLCDLLQLDAGLRLGEALGLRWSDVRWGDVPDDTARSLSVEETRARGRFVGTTKSGRSRRVALSRRLRALLRERWMAAGRPEGAVRLLPRLDQSNYRSRHFRRVCVAAGLVKDPKARRPEPTHSPKDLRDTYASQLLTAGVQLGYVSRQLGHADVAVTARHYARWAGGDAYRAALEVLPGENPADLLARLRPQKGHTLETGASGA